MCCPSSGAAADATAGVSLNFHGNPTICVGPFVGCSTVSTYSFASACGSSSSVS